MMFSHGSLKVRDPLQIAHTISGTIRAWAFAICRRYKHAADFDVSRSVRAFKRACGRLFDSGRGPCTELTLSRLANAPSLKDVIRLIDAFVDIGRRQMQRPRPRSRLTSTTPVTSAPGDKRLVGQRN
jgi:hypothetical protein